MAQVRTKSVGIHSVVRTPAFRQGVQDYIKGRPGRWDAFGLDTNKAWAYERGRLAAAWAKGAGRKIPTKWFINRRLTYEAQDFGNDALLARAIL